MFNMYESLGLWEHAKHEALGARALAKLVWGGPSFGPHDHPKLNQNNKIKKLLIVLICITI